MPLTPKNRKEQWLEGLVQHETTLTPKNRPETWMKEIIDASGGGGGGTGVLVLSLNNPTLEKTFAEINTALSSGVVIGITNTNPDGVDKTVSIATGVYSFDDGGELKYGVAFYNIQDQLQSLFETNAENGYPTFVNE